MKYLVAIFFILTSSVYAKTRSPHKRTFLFFAPSISSPSSFRPLDSTRAWGGVLGVGTHFSNSSVLRLQFSYHQNKQNLPTTQANESGVTATASQTSLSQTLAATLGFQFLFFPRYTISPYLSIDAGAAWNRSSTDLTVDSNTQNFTFDNGFSLLALAGFGFNFSLSHSLSVFIEDSIGRNGSNNTNFLKAGLEFSL